MEKMNLRELLELSERRRQAALRVIRDSGVVEAWESVGATVNLVGSVRSGLVMKNLDIDFHIYTDEPMLEKSLAAMERLKQNPAIRDVQLTNLLDTGEECLEWHAWYEDVEARGDMVSAGSNGAGSEMADLDKAGFKELRLDSTGSKRAGLKEVGLKAAHLDSIDLNEVGGRYTLLSAGHRLVGVDMKIAVWRLDMIHIRRGSAFDGVIERTTDAVIARLDPETSDIRAIHEANQAREAILRIKHDAPAGVETPGIEVYYAVLELGLRTYDEFAAWKKANPNIDLLGWMP